MNKEVIYFCAELLNYWSMTFFGLKLFAKVYDFEIHKNSTIANMIYAILCFPIAIICAVHYYFVVYSNFLTHVIVVYMCLLIGVISLKNRKISLSSIGFWIYGMRLIDLWVVAVIKEMNRVSRHIYVDLINEGFSRVIFLVVLSLSYCGLYKICYKTAFISYVFDRKLYRRMLFTYSLIGNFCFSVVYLSNFSKEIIHYWTFYLVCAFILIGTSLFYLIGIKGKERERMLSMRNDMMEANYQGLKKVYETNRTLQHDHKNHLLTISILINECKNNEALDYIKNYMDVKQNTLSGIKSGNDILDIIVNSKINEARESKIDFLYDVDYLNTLSIKDIDICALMGNLLDNAIEACEKIQKGSWINLKIGRRNNMLLIHLGNSVHKESHKKICFFRTEKKDVQLHGWGMKSIENVVRKYGGNIGYQISDSQIEIFINIPIE